MKTGNALLQSLSVVGAAKVLARTEHIRMSAGDVLRIPGARKAEVLFPLSGVISVARSLGGEPVEAHLIGREGASGLEPGLGFDVAHDWVTVTIPGEALRIDAGVFADAFKDEAAFRSAIQRYQANLLDDLKQRAACGVGHLLQQRLAGWLLRCRLRTESDDFRVTQSHLSQVLGVQRTTISNMARRMRQGGLLRYSRGSLRVTDWQALEGVACQCHRHADPANGLAFDGSAEGRAAGSKPSKRGLSFSPAPDEVDRIPWVGSNDG